MDQNEALNIVEEYKERHGHPGTLEALTAMKEAFEMRELTPRERVAFTTAFNGFRRLFYGDEAECITCQVRGGSHKPWCSSNPAYRAGDWN